TSVRHVTFSLARRGPSTHETPPVHHSAWRRGGVATRGARTAGDCAGDRHSRDGCQRRMRSVYVLFARAYVRRAVSRPRMQSSNMGGRISSSRSSLFGATSMFRLVTPVTLPPGRLRLVFAASAAGVVEATPVNCRHGRPTWLAVR